MKPDVTLLTPTYDRDYDRFCLQRESIERCGVNLRHVAIVDHEDLPKFRDVPHQRNLTLCSTRDLLPRRMELKRRAWGVRRRYPIRWVAGAPIHGWTIQQFLKLASPSVVTTDGIVCLDSDTLFVGRVTASDLRTGERLHLYETSDDLDAEMAEWLGRSMRFLDVKPTRMPVTRFVHSPVVLHRQVVLEMQAFIRRKFGGCWMAAMNGAGVTEYTTYGVFAKYVSGRERIEPVRPELSHYFWWADDVNAMERGFGQRVIESGAKLVTVQSNVGRKPETYRPLLQPLWDAVQRVEPAGAAEMAAAAV